MSSKKLEYALLAAMLVIIPIVLIAPAVSAPAEGTFTTGEPGIPGQTVSLEIFPDTAVHADIFGHRIVYQDRREGDDWEIFLYNLTSGREYQLTNDTIDQIAPAISCDYVIYYEETDEGWDLVLYRINGDEACTAICPDCAEIYGPPCPPGAVCPPQRNCPAGFTCPPSGRPCGCTANFTWTPDSPMANGSVNFSGTYDLTGTCADTVTVRNWTWDFGDESNATFGQNATHAFEESGVYAVSLMVTLGNGNTCNVTRNVTIGVVPCNCTADFTWMPQPGIVNESLDFSAVVNTTGTCNLSGRILNWTFGDNSSGTGEEVSHTYATVGNYTVELDVTFDNETVCMATHEVPVVAEAPTVCNCSVNLTWSPETPQIDSDVMFQGEVSISEGCNATADTWLWTFGDGNTSAEQNPLYAYNAAGTFPVTLDVTLTDGTFCTDTGDITVIAAPPVETMQVPAPENETGTNTT
ncbi:MAG: PKD domain-containing protein [Methanomicrobiales archaeon]|nr:PKD domain-containing protein [Methanomicrobiales archaeon]